MRHTRHYIFLALSLLMLYSCNEKVEQSKLRSISFGSQAEGSKESKSSMGDGIVSSTTENMRSQPFGIYGHHSNAEGQKFVKGSNDVFNTSEAISVAHNGASWEYSPLAYWSFNDYYRFRAYHPYSGNAFSVLPASNVDLISIDYKVVNGNEDLMVAFWKGQATEAVISDRVPMKFKHCLSGLKINIGLTDDSRTDNITELYIKGLTPNGTMLYTHENPEGSGEGINYDTEVMKWLASTYDSDTEFYKWKGSKEIPQNVTAADYRNAKQVFDGSEHMVFAIPQTCSGAKGETKVYFKTEKGGAAIQSVTLPTTDWLPGHIYTYTLLMAPTSKIDVLISIKPWEGVEINEDIHIL